MLGYGQTYKVTGTALGKAGTKAKISSTYTTVAPAGIINSWISPTDGDTVGIGAPIMIGINAEIDDHAARARIEKAITVTTVPKTEGSFAWIQHDDGWGLDWRPKNYWESGTKVSVKADLYGVDLGNGLWGEKDISSSFTIGRAEVVKGDVNTHRLQVYIDKKLVYDFPTSYGLESDPGPGDAQRHLHRDEQGIPAPDVEPGLPLLQLQGVLRGADLEQRHLHPRERRHRRRARVRQRHPRLREPVDDERPDLLRPGDLRRPGGDHRLVHRVSASDGDTYDWTIPWGQWVTMSALYKA